MKEKRKVAILSIIVSIISMLLLVIIFFGNFTTIIEHNIKITKAIEFSKAILSGIFASALITAIIYLTEYSNQKKLIVKKYLNQIEIILKKIRNTPILFETKGDKLFNDYFEKVYENKLLRDKNSNIIEKQYFERIVENIKNEAIEDLEFYNTNYDCNIKLHDDEIYQKEADEIIYNKVARIKTILDYYKKELCGLDLSSLETDLSQIEFLFKRKIKKHLVNYIYEPLKDKLNKIDIESIEISQRQLENIFQISIIKDLIFSMQNLFFESKETRDNPFGDYLVNAYFYNDLLNEVNRVKNLVYGIDFENSQSTIVDCCDYPMPQSQFFINKKDTKNVND